MLAGAGTGKTRVVIARIGHLVWRGAKPARILAVTFTNKAAREMLARAAKGLKKGLDEKPEISTIHSLCVRILRRHASRLGYPERFAIIDRGEQEAAARSVLKELKIADTVLRPADLLDRVSRWKSRAVRADVAMDAIPADADDSWTLAAAGYRRYQNSLQTAGAVDFDDLLLLVDELFSQHEDVRRVEAGRFDHLLIDEYQDTSGIQERILSALARDHRSICVVGDDDQSIYAWRGAEVAHILDFASRWPGARIVRLEENYRSTPEIIRAANMLIERNGRRHGKTLIPTAAPGVPPAIIQAQDEVDESRRVVADVESLLRERLVVPTEAVILVRTGEQTRTFEQELRRRNIPYELVGSRSFFDRREVKDVMSFLRVLVEPDDDLALSRIANVPPRGLASSTVQAARAAATAAGHSLWRELLGRRDSGQLSPAARAGVDAIARLVAFRESGPAPAPGQSRGAAVLLGLLDAAGYKRFLEKDYEDDPAEAETRWACVEEVAGALDEHERARPGKRDLAAIVRGFLDDFVLQCRVTFFALIEAKGTPAGVMGVFPEVLRAHILAAIPKAPALLEHILSHVDPALLDHVLAIESSRAAAQIPASRKRVRAQDPEDPGVIQEPDHAQLLCDENIGDLAPECSTGTPDGKTVSADHEEASGQTTPPPTKMSKQARFDLTCAPRKMRP